MLLRKVFLVLVVSALPTLAATPGLAGNKTACSANDACTVLRAGHVRGRIPVACISIPFIKKGYGQVAMFVMRDFNPNVSPEEIQEQLTHALFKDSKVTGAVDDFCRKPAKFAGGLWVVFCDDYGVGWITGKSLAYALRVGHPPGNRRVRIGTRVVGR